MNKKEVGKYQVWAEGKWSGLPYALCIWNFWDPEIPWRALKPSNGTWKLVAKIKPLEVVLTAQGYLILAKLKYISKTTLY